MDSSRGDSRDAPKEKVGAAVVAGWVPAAIHAHQREDLLTKSDIMETHAYCQS